MSRRAIAAVGAGLLLTATGCESSQDRSAQLQKQGAKLIANQPASWLFGLNNAEISGIFIVSVKLIQ